MGHIESQFIDRLVEKSMLFPNQALPPPVYTNFSQLQAAAQRIPGVKDPERKTSMPAESPTHHDTSGVGTLSNKHLNPAPSIRRPPATGHIEACT